MNTGAPWPGLDEAEARVLEIQAKLHQWAKVAPNRRFDDLYNLVYDPAILVVAWSRVRTNRGARSAGVDKVEPRSIVSPMYMSGRLRTPSRPSSFWILEAS